VIFEIQIGVKLMLLLCLPKKLKMEGFNHRCFVCRMDVTGENPELNTEVNLPVCNHCKGTKEEKETVAEFLDSLADGLVCGCI
jgi:hypothetical protein